MTNNFKISHNFEENKSNKKKTQTKNLNLFYKITTNIIKIKPKRKIKKYKNVFNIKQKIEQRSLFIKTKKKKKTSCYRIL